MVRVRISNDSPTFDIPKPTKVLVWGRVVGDLALFLLAMCSVILAFATSIGSLHLGEVGLNKKNYSQGDSMWFFDPLFGGHLIFQRVT